MEWNTQKIAENLIFYKKETGKQFGREKKLNETEETRPNRISNLSKH